MHVKNSVVMVVLGLVLVAAGCSAPADDATVDPPQLTVLSGLGSPNPDPGPVVARLVAEVDPRFVLLDPTLVAEWAGQTCGELRRGLAPEDVADRAAARFSADTTSGHITVTAESGRLVVAAVAPSCWVPTR